MALLGLAAPANVPAGAMKVGSFPQTVSVRYSAADGVTGPVAGIACDGRKVFAKTTQGTLTLDGNRWRAAAPGDRAPAFEPSLPVPGPSGVFRSAAKTRSGEWWAVTDGGAFRLQGGKWAPLGLPTEYVAHQPMPNIDLSIRQVLSDPSGHVWVATTFGAYLTDGANWWQPLDRTDGMPYQILNCMALGANGDIWGGADEGAWRLRNGQWRYFWGRRWLPGNVVHAIAVDAAGRAWIGTDNGVAMIEDKPMTLPEKAEHYEKITQARHSRSGWVAGCRLKEAGRPEAGFVHDAS
ncbi:MAG: hypothetical protein FJX72_15570, partial [Armatimonadetes bacterium]|nr:hypothetical protein [Armatimonadota bacterium]